MDVFFLTWIRQHQQTYNSTSTISDVWYAVLDGSGSVVRGATKLTDSVAGSDYTAVYHSAALTRLTGSRALLTFSGYDSLLGSMAIYYAALDSDGNIQHPITQLADNVWGIQPAATQLPNGRTVVAWVSEAPPNPGEQDWAVQYFNNETLTGEPVATETVSRIYSHWGYASPAPGVNPDHFSVRWQGTIEVIGGDYIFTMGSDDGSRLWIDGELVMDYWDSYCQYWNRTVALTPGAHSVRMEMREISGAAWTYLGWQQDAEDPVVTFAVLNANLHQVAGPTAVGRTAASDGSNYVSLTHDANNHAIFTWMDDDYFARRNLYYALVDSNGAVLTRPMILQASQTGASRIETSFYGYGNTTYSWTPPAGVDSALAATPSLAPALPGGSALPITVELKGRGGTPATSVRLTAALDPRLSYVSDTSGVTPTVSGQTVTWNLPNLRLFDIRQFQINLQTTASILGELLPVQLQLTSAEPDLTPADNQATVQVWISQPLYLPLVVRQ